MSEELKGNGHCQTLAVDDEPTEGVVGGADATVATACLGAFWAIVYLRRRSVVAPMVSHSGFNLIEILLFAASPK